MFGDGAVLFFQQLLVFLQVVKIGQLPLSAFDFARCYSQVFDLPIDLFLGHFSRSQFEPLARRLNRGYINGRQTVT